MVDWALIGAIAVVVGVMLTFWLAKKIFKIALVIGVAVLLFLGAQRMGWIGG